MDKSCGGETVYIPPLPPNFGKKVGRPEKSRRIGCDEVQRKGKKGKPGPKKTKKRQQTTVTCGYCRGKYHNIATCKLKQQHLEEEVELIDTEVQDEENARTEADTLMAEAENQVINEEPSEIGTCLSEVIVQPSTQVSKRYVTQNPPRRSKRSKQVQTNEAPVIQTQASINSDPKMKSQQLQEIGATSEPIVEVQANCGSTSC